MIQGKELELSIVEPFVGIVTKGKVDFRDVVYYRLYHVWDAEQVMTDAVEIMFSSGKCIYVQESYNDIKEANA